MDSLVSTGWLARHLGESDLRVLDASWYLPEDGRDPEAEYRAGHIPGALRFDIDRIADRESGLPHMLPSAHAFAEAVGALGIGNDDRVAIYDGGGVHAAARAWWMFRVFSHRAVAVLDGGIGKWRAEGRPLERRIPRSPSCGYAARRRPELVVDSHELLAELDAGGATVLDARSAERFAGAEPEPRAGVEPGHIPGSRNLPWRLLYDAEGCLQPTALLQVLTMRAGVDFGKPAIASCGSGVTACSIALALDRLGHRHCAVYDGSWAEWGGDPALPKATGSG